MKTFSNLVSLISCKLETGRTHQIRVHMSSIGHSLIGVKIYGGLPKKNKIQNRIQKNIITKCKSFSRQALHSKTLTFEEILCAKNSRIPLFMLIPGWSLLWISTLDWSIPSLSS